MCPAQVLFSRLSFDQAREQAKRLATEYDCCVGIRRSGDFFEVVGPVESDSPEEAHRWRHDLNLKLYFAQLQEEARLRQEESDIEEIPPSLSYTEEELSELVYDENGELVEFRVILFEMRSQPDPRWSEDENLRQEEL